MSTLLENLESYGVDIKATMVRFIDDESLYTHCLSVFFEGKEFMHLESAISAKDYNAAFEVAHTIKGLTGNLGLTPLYEKVCALIEPLRHNDIENLDALYSSVLEELEKATEIWNASQE